MLRRTLDKSDLIHLKRLSDHRLKLTLAILGILIALHGVRLARTSLSVGKQGRMETTDNLLDLFLDTNLLEEFTLVNLAIAYFVELELLRLFVPRVIL